MTSSHRRGTLAGVLGLILVLLAGCGLSSGTSTVTQTPGGAVGSPSASASASTTATLQAGAVAVVLDESHYAPSDTINATILNGLDHSIWAADHQTDCTVVSVQQQTSTGWQTVGRCLLATPTRMQPIAASSSTQVQLESGQAGNGGVAWSAGLYRIALTYLDSDEGNPGANSPVYSATFTMS